MKNNQNNNHTNEQATTIKPMRDLVLVRTNLEEHAGMIIVPEMAKRMKQSGEVLAVGPGIKLHNGDLLRPEIEVGDTVLFTMYAGTDISVGGESLKLIPSSELLGVEV